MQWSGWVKWAGLPINPVAAVPIEHGMTAVLLVAVRVRARLRCLRARRGRTDRGAAAVEYLFLLVLVAVACLAALRFFGAGNESSFSEFGSTVGTLVP